MVLRALALVALVNVPLTGPKDAPPERMDARAECLKACAGAPKTATGTMLLQCIKRCEVTPDAGS